MAGAWVCGGGIGRPGVAAVCSWLLIPASLENLIGLACLPWALALPGVGGYINNRLEKHDIVVHDNLYYNLSF